MNHFARIFVSLGLIAGLAAPADAGPWTSSGPEGGNITALVIDPSTTSTIYAGTQGGVFKSTDGGANWSISNDGLTEYFVFSLAIDPSSPSTLYAGTLYGGVFKSDDGGADWFTVTDPVLFPDLGTAPVASLAIDPQAPGTVYAGTTRGMFKTEDGGASWVEVGLSNEFILSLAIDPSNPAVVYAGTIEGVFKSTDGGSQWAPVGPELFEVRALALDPSSPTTLYAATFFGVFKSTDGGADWTLTPGAKPYAVTVVVDPSTPSIVYAGTLDDRVYKSVDRGESWTPAFQGLTNPSVYSLAIDPRNSATVYVGTGYPNRGGAGVFKSADGGANWSPTNRGLTATSISAIATGGRDSLSVVAGNLLGTVYRSSDRGSSWQAEDLGFGGLPIHDLAFDELSSSFFAATPAGVFRSPDAGGFWEPTGYGPQFARELKVSRQGTLYAATRSDGVFSLFQSSNGGDLWTAIGPDVEAGLETLAIDPMDSSTLYVGSTFGRVFKSTDGGATWSLRDDGIKDSEIVYALVATPTGVLAGTLNGLFRTDDGGARWSLVARDFIAQTLVVDPVSPDVMYAGTFFQGVQRSVDGGVTWSAFNTGLNHERIEKLAIDSSPSRRIYAATPGGGVFFRDTIPACDDPTVLCLQDERFQVTVDWKTNTLDGPARVVPFGTQDSGIFYFFGEDNWELLVKVLDGCGLNQRFWVFSAATTNVEYTLTVTDRLTGETTSYFNPANTVAAAITDTDALADACLGGGTEANASGLPARSVVPGVKPATAKTVDVSAKETCMPSSTVACVGENGRFRVEAEWRDFDDNEGPGRSVANVPSDSSGLFYFFGENNWEVLFKVLDACTFNDHFWFFAAATTNVEYTLRVTDTMTGAEASYGNPLGVASPATTDTSAFPCS